MPLIGTKNISPATTEAKIRTVLKTRPETGRYVADLFGVDIGIQAPGGYKPKELSKLDSYTKNVLQTLFSAELRAYSTVTEAVTSTSSAISGIGLEIRTEIQGVKAKIGEALRPISTATGNTLGALTNVARNPLGAPLMIGRSLMSVVDKISPDFTNKLNATYKKHKLTELANLPGQAIGSIRSLAFAADAILAVPFQMAADLYNGLKQIIKEISDLVDGVIAEIFAFFFGPEGILDSLIPIDAILEFLDAVSELGTIAGVIGQYVNGLQIVEDISLMAAGYANSIEGFLTNPSGLLQQYIPEEVSQTIKDIRDPEKFINSFVPESLMGELRKIGQIPGLGFVGNLGYGIGNTLDALKDGVVIKAIKSFDSQSGILGEILNLEGGAMTPQDLQESFKQKILPSSFNSLIPTIKEIPIQEQPKEKILKEKDAFSYERKSGSRSTTRTIKLGSIIP